MKEKLNINTPNSPSDITMEWLNNALSSEIFSEEITSIEIDENFGIQSLLGKVVRVKLNYADKESEPKSVLVKFQVHCSNKKRESEIYKILSEENISYIPDLYGIFGNGNIILEDLSATHSVLKENLTITQIKNVVARLADVNSKFYNNPSVPKDDVSHFVNSININMGQSWDRFKNRYNDQLGKDEEVFKWMWENAKIVSEQFSSGTQALNHGDVNNTNLLFPNDGSDQPVLIDWQLSGHKVLPFDLSYFLVKSLSVKQRRKHEEGLIKEYYEMLPGKIKDKYTFDKMVLEYRACVFRSMLSAVTKIGPKFDHYTGRNKSADELSSRVIEATRDLNPREAIEELEKYKLLK